MKFEAVSFTLVTAGVAFQSIEVYDTPKIMTITASNVPLTIMEAAEEVMSGLDIEAMELYTIKGKENIIYKNVYIEDARIKDDKLILKVEK